MKQLILFLTCVILFACMITGVPVYAADCLQVKLTPPENVKANKAFDIYVEYSCSMGISSMLSKFEYDKSMLEFRSAKLMDLIDDRFFYAKDYSGQIGVAYSNINKTVDKLTVCLRFSPIQEAEEYTVKVSDCQACYNETDKLTADYLPTCTVRVGQAENTVNNKSDVSSKVSSGSSSEGNTQHSSRQSIQDENDRNETASSSHETETPENGDNRVYYIKSQEKNVDNGQTMFMAVIGLAVVFAAAVVFAFRAGVRKNQKSK